MRDLLQEVRGVWQPENAQKDPHECASRQLSVGQEFFECSPYGHVSKFWRVGGQLGILRSVSSKLAKLIYTQVVAASANQDPD